MVKSSSKQSSSKSKSSGSKSSSSKSKSTVPVDRSWQDPTLDRGQRSAQGSNGNYPVGRWLTEPAWQEPFNNIGEVPAAGSAAGYAGASQGSGAAATYATSQHRR
ncbi:hypothetical protein CkaCkLH20_08546 [Colletotrichum karsti]|uniref:Uncharacterized protein n=1 Tax=Colletotrichum karsti TaxID=1095194 RepID=A0A9P6LIN9_9PEZI|nr:uncharacterized protein CkaCkLH20_08546 [Colletotrichum karsti]KAF9873812.1 hypothetical protein CkaCkLH20_08546 [Colletotrichum karsti]